MREIRLLFAALRNPLAWLALLAALALASIAYQFPLFYNLELGSPRSAPYLRNFYPPQEIAGRAARWSAAFSYISLPGTGGDRPLRITIPFNPLRQGVTNPPPITVVGIVGGETLYTSTLQPNSGWQTITLDVDASHPAALAARDLIIELRTDVYRPPDYQGNELGIAASSVSIEPLPGAGWRPVVPNVRVMLLFLALVLGVCLLVSRLGAGAADPRLSARFAALSALVVGLIASVGIALDMVEFVPALGPLVLFVIATYALLVAAVYILPPLWPALRAEGRAAHAALNFRPLYGLLIIAPILFNFAFQTQVSYKIDIGSGRDEPFITGFNPPMFPMPNGEPGDYRYTSQRASISIPGVGTGNVYSVTLRLNPGTGPASRGDVQVVANGTEVAHGVPSPGWQDVAFQVNTGPPRWFEGSSIDIVIKAPVDVVEGGEQRGVMLDSVSIVQLGNAAPLSRSPAQEAGLLAGVLLLYLLVMRAAGRAAPLHVRGMALGVTLLAAFVAAVMLGQHRVEMAVALPHLLLTLAAGYVLLAISSHLLPRFPAVVHSLFVAAFMLRFGYSALPQMIVIDLPYHIGWLRRLVGGDFAALYFPGQLSQVPPEWNLDVLIPKSPLFYMAMWPLGLFKGLDLAPAVLFVVSLLDASLVPAIYALGRRASRGGAAWGAGLYAVMPLAFRAFAYGILPTIFAQTLTLYVVLVPLQWAGRLRRPTVFAGWVLLLTASLIAFPTALAFNSFVIFALALGWRLRRAAPARTEYLLLGGLALGLVLSVLLYYGLYIPPFFSRTLPALLGGTSLRGEPLWPGGPLEMVGWTGVYVVNWLPQLMLPVALLLVWRARRAESKLLSVLMAAWLAVLVLGMLLNLRFDMIGKHLYYTMPAAALGGGIVLARLWSLRRWSAALPRTLACLSALSVLWAAVNFMASRL